MKRVLFSLVLLLASSLSFAQLSAVKQAKSIANGTNPDFDKAVELIEGALVNDETKDMAETWNVAGFVHQRRYDEEYKKYYLQQDYNKDNFYSSLLKMCQYWIKCDELAQIPDEKGKVKNKYRKANAAKVMQEKVMLLNGGVEYNNQASGLDEAEANKSYALARDYFGGYVEVSTSKLLEDVYVQETDSFLAMNAYYASRVAYLIQDWDGIVKYAPYGVKDEEFGKHTMELYCLALKEKGDTDTWVAALQDGVKLYPDYDFFFGSLIDYYSNNDKYGDAMAFADEMLATDPSKPFYLFVKAFLYHNMKDYDNALTYYQKTTDADPSYAQAYSNIGLIYCIQAQDFSEQATADVNDPKYAEDQQTLKSFYEKARPAYEKARELKPEEQDLWLNGLYRVYYNLNLGPQLDEIEKLLPQ